MKSYSAIFDQSVAAALTAGLRLARNFPKSAEAIARVIGNLPRAKKRRNAWDLRGVAIPPLLIVSTTKRCNLRCKGCYSQAQCREEKPEMTRPQIDTLLDQASDAGIAMVLLAGGEPLLCADWLEGVAARPELLGLVFTNGTLLGDAAADWFSSNRNMLPLFSIEGDAKRTDARRGDGVAAQVEDAASRLAARNIPFGLSITTGEHNIDQVAAAGFFVPYSKKGCCFSIHVEYVPMDDSDALFALTPQNKERLQEFCNEAPPQTGMLHIAFPGDETAFDGCLAAGRGFAHISASGQLEPCPFAAFSDRNVLEIPLVDALASPLFAKLRAESHLLHEGAGGCSLRNHIALIN